jgi:hypothetical protein
MTLTEQKCKWWMKLTTLYEGVYDTKLGRIIIWSMIGFGFCIILTGILALVT